MTFWQPVHTFKIACGAGGSYVDVTSKILYDQGGVTRSYGRQSAFSDFTGGIFSFTIDNRDGSLTPDNPAAGATPLSEGMYVTWQTDTRLLSGKIAVGGGIQFIFPDPGNPASARLRITVSDMLVEASRFTPKNNLAYSQAIARAFMFYPLSDPAGAGQLSEVTGNGTPLLSTTNINGPSGVVGVPATGGDTQIQVMGGQSLVSTTKTTNIALASGSLGFVGAWVTLNQLSVGALNGCSIGVQINNGGFGLGFNLTNSGGVARLSGSMTGAAVAFPAGSSAYVVAGYTYVGTTTTETLYLNGVVVATGTVTTASPPTVITSLSGFVGMFVAGATDSVNLSHLSYGPVLVHEEGAGITTEAGRLTAIGQTTAQLVLATLPANLSTAPVGIASTNGQSVLDMLNDVIRTEQGQFFTGTTGSGTAPVQTVGIRGRDRPPSPTASTTWVTKVDITGTPDQERDLSNTVSEVDANGIGASAVLLDAALAQKVSSANTSFAVINNGLSDVTEAGSDRMNRGRKTGIDVVSFVVDGMGLLVSRATDLLALTLGDRHRVSGLPSAQLGYSTRDGFLIGVDESWTPVSGRFTLYLENCPAATAIFDTDEFANGGNNLISTAMTSGTTSMVVNSADGLTWFSNSGTMLVDAEQMTITGATTPAGGTQTLTVTRGVNGTTATTHAVGASPEVLPTAIFAY